jgi:predicted nucleotidyltransferase component of viral defense system
MNCRTRWRTTIISEPGTTLDIVVEANVTERTPHRQIVEIPFEFLFRDAPVKTLINGYEIHEMIGTKMRALFQRRRGRDLFDLYWALTLANPPIDPTAVIESFQHYLTKEGNSAGRAEFIGILEAHLGDRGFCSDMDQLLRTGASYDAQEAGEYVKANLLKLLPD